MKIRRILASLAITFTLMVQATLLVAQEADGFDYEVFDVNASRAEDVIEKAEASTAALEALRTTMADFRSAALDEQELQGRAAKDVRDQINALGEAPAEGETEDPENAALRAELNAELEVARAPVLTAEAAYQRANNIVKNIDGIIRKRLADEFLKLSPMPINPVLWGPALVKAGQHSEVILDEASDALQNANRIQARKKNGPILFFLTVLGLFFLIPAFRWAVQNFQKYTVTQRSSRDEIRRFVLSFAVFALPLIGFLLILRAINLADIVGLRGSFLMAAMVKVAISIYGGNWLARNLFVSDGPAAKLLGLDQAKVSGGRFTVQILGYLIAAKFILDGFAQGASWGDETHSIFEFPLVVMGGIGLFQLSSWMKQYCDYKSSDTTFNVAYERFARLTVLFCRGVSILGPIGAAIGYVNAGSTLVFSTLLSLALAAALFILFSLLVGFLRILDKEEPTPLAETGQGGTGSGLYRVALGFLFICAAVPVLALIWGARVSELKDVWLYLRDGISLGNTRLSASDMLTFILIFFVGYTITRLLQSALRSNVLPNTRFDTGAQNAMVTGFGYLGIFLSALIAITSTGLDLSNLAIVAGALSVGIGFGLQAIVSNFVSGIILLIERPIKAGDWVEVGAHAGYVQNISVRSTTIDTFDRATVIVPNADLITGTVINRTHGNSLGRVIVPVGVAYGTNVRQVEEILLDIANNHAQVRKSPPPQVMFIGFGADSLNFEIRAILRDVNWSVSVRSDMNYEIAERFEAAKIEIPFAQRDINIKNPEALATFLQEQSKPKSKPRSRKPKAE